MNKKTIYSALILLALLTACDMSGGGSDWNPDRQAAIRVKINTEGIRGRTVMPSLALQDVTKWELWGGKQGDAETLLDEFVDSTGTDAELTLGVATWHFTLKGFKGSDLILTGSITEQNIIVGTNVLDFTVAPLLEGQGSLNIVINLPAGSGINMARVWVFVEDDDDLEYPITPTNDQIVFQTPYDAGAYYFSVRLYKDGVLYGAVSEIVHVWANLQSEKTYTLAYEDLNLTYVITYHWGDTETDFGYYQYTDAAITLPPPTYTVEGRVFRGWYDNPAFSGSAVTTILTDSTGDKHFYARWVAAEQVSSSLSFEEALQWVKEHAEDGGVYAITINENEQIPPHPLDYDGKNVNVVLNGGNAERIVSLTMSGSLFTVGSGVTLTLGNNVSLQGRNNNTELVRVNNGGTLVMNDGSKINGNSNSSGNGGGAYVADGGTWTMTGGEISGNTTTNGGGVYVSSNGTFTQSGGTISGNTATYGGGVYAYNTFTMTGGTVSGNTASTYGGGVYAYNTFTMTGGAVSGNTAAYGGGVYVESSSTFTMTGGAVSSNTSSYYGGGVYTSGTFTLSGGVIDGNTAPTGGGVYASGTFIKQAGGTIYGSTAGDSLKNTATNGDNYGHAVYVYSNGSIRNSTAGFGVLLDSGATSGGWETFVSSSYSLAQALDWIATDITTNSVESGAYVIMVNNDESLGTRALSYGNGKNISIALHGGNAERIVSLTTATGPLFTLGNGVTLTLGNNVSLQGLSNNTAPLVRVNNGGSLVMEGGSKISGNDNTTASGTAVAGNGGGAYVASGGVFTMNGGEISGNSARFGGGVYVVDGGTFTKRTDGNIYGSNASDSLKNTATEGGDYGYAVYVNSSPAKIRSATAGFGVALDGAISGSAGGWETLILSDLSLEGALARIASDAEAGGVYMITINADETIAPTTLSYSVGNVSVILDGGDVERTVSLSSDGSLFTVENGVTLTLGNNVSLQGRSDNTTSLVQVNNGGTLVMDSGSKISGNSASSYGGGVYSDGTVTMNGGTISGNFSSNGGGAYIASGSVFTQNGGTISDNSSSGGGGGVYVYYYGTFTQSGGEISDNSAPNSGGGGVYVSYGTFTQSGGTISDNSSNFGGGVVVSYGTFTQNGGTISDNSSNSGGGVYVDDGTFTQSGGTINGNTASGSGYGGGVYVSSGTFTKQSGGTIYGSNASDSLKNTATGGDYGHAVYVNSSPEKIRNNTAGLGVTLNSAVVGAAGGWETTIPSNLSLADSLTWITNNAEEGGSYTITINEDETIDPTPLSYGVSNVSIILDGGDAERTVSLSTTGSLFTVGNGVTLTLGNNVSLQGRSDNTASLVYVNGGALVMDSGSKISGNSNSSSSGGGVYVDSGGTFTMSNGTISGNSSAINAGGGVYVSYGTFTINGGIINNNTAGASGGGVNVSGTFTMSGGTISGNTANHPTYGGGGVFMNSGTWTMSGGTISGNTATYAGGGVYVYGNATFTKQAGGIIYGSNETDSTLKNTASGDDYGHAVYVESGSKLRNNTAGSGVTLDSATSGSAGGWEIAGFLYSAVPGSAEWIVEPDGSRKSPAIGHGAVTKARISFTSTAGASITILLRVSSEPAGSQFYDGAFISQLDNADATYSNGYYPGSLIYGETSVEVTIPIPTAGDHFIDIGYRKDGSVDNGSDCAWFTVIQ
jgi:hypothetical protein